MTVGVMPAHARAAMKECNQRQHVVRLTAPSTHLFGFVVGIVGEDL